jgi:hypothetical protein
MNAGTMLDRITARQLALEQYTVLIAGQRMAADS